MSTHPASIVAPPPAAVTVHRPGPSSYRQILKSSVLVGGSTALSIGIRLVRTKALAVLLGPAGVGLLGLFTSVADLVQNIAGLGINSSGVRQIAEAVGSGDSERVGRTVTALRRVALVLGLTGSLFLILFSRPIARLTFGNDQHAGALVLLAVMVFFGVISMGQVAVVQGMHRVFDLARARVLGAVYGLLIGVPVIFIFREEGIVASLVLAAVAMSFTLWRFGRKIEVARPAMSWRDVRREAGSLLRLGVAFTITDPLNIGVLYLTRVIVMQHDGPDAVGQYQAAWVLAGLYVGFILDAMGTDFFPRLTPLVHDRQGCRRLVNEQVEVGLLLAGPGVLATLTLAELVIQVCYSAQFGPAVEVLRWICLGMLLRIASWPLGYILRAAGAAGPLIWTEVAKHSVHAGLVWVCVLAFGLAGCGVAFFGSYIFYTVMIYLIVRHSYGFRWSRANLRLAVWFGVMVAVVFGAWYLLPRPVAIGGCLVLTALAAFQSAQQLWSLGASGVLPARLREVVDRFRARPA